MHSQTGSYRQYGVTLLELLVVVAIVSIIAAIAYPSYTQFVINTKRTAATTTLLQIADRQQQFFMDNKRYAGSLTNLGYAADLVTFDDNGQTVPTADEDRIYTVEISASTAMTYTLTATPLDYQATKDSECGNLTLTNTAAKSNSGPGSDCW